MNENLDEAKITATNRVRYLAKVRLSDTDYKVVRQMEQPVLSDSDFAALKAERQSVRDACNALEANIAACTIVAEVHALVPEAA